MKKYFNHVICKGKVAQNRFVRAIISAKNLKDVEIISEIARSDRNRATATKTHIAQTLREIADDMEEAISAHGGYRLPEKGEMKNWIRQLRHL